MIFKQMGALTSRQNATVEETENASSHAYKYPPKSGKKRLKIGKTSNFNFYFFFSGNYFSSHFIMGGERFENNQPEAYLFGENADLNFLGSKPTAVSFKRGFEGQGSLPDSSTFSFLIHRPNPTSRPRR